MFTCFWLSINYTPSLTYLLTIRFSPDERCQECSEKASLICKMISCRTASPQYINKLILFPINNYHVISYSGFSRWSCIAGSNLPRTSITTSFIIWSSCVVFNLQNFAFCLISFLFTAAIVSFADILPVIHNNW